MASRSSAIALSDTQRADARAEVRLTIILAMLSADPDTGDIGYMIEKANLVMDRLKEERDKEAGLK
jgi:hypothetical protein